jgi:soluble lytic murein transglycosylase-like protein
MSAPNISAQTRLVLSSLGLGLILISPFIGRMAWNHWQTAPTTGADQVGQLIAQRQYERAYDRLLAIDEPLTPNQHLQAALCERLLKRPADAYARLHRLTDLENGLEEYRRFWMSRSLDEMGEKKSAIAAYSDFLAAATVPALADTVYLRLPQLHAKTGEPRRALALYGTYLKLRPKLKAEILHRMAALYDQVDNPEAAQRTRLRLVDEHPKHYRARKALKKLPAPANSQRAWQYANIYYSTGSYKSAAKTLETFGRRYPKNKHAAEARYLLARAYQASGLYLKAQKAFEHIHKKDKRASAHYRIGGLLVKRNHDTRAIAHYGEFARLYPRHELAPRALWQAAKAAERNDRLSQAAKLFTRVAAEYPSSSYAEEAAWSVGFMRFCRADFSDALERFQKLGRNATQPHIVDQSLFWAGKTALKLELADEARLYFQRAANGFPRSYYASRAVAMGFAPKKDLPPRPRAAIISAAGLALAGRPLLERANALAEIGLIDLARAELLRLEKRNSTDATAMHQIQAHYERLGIWDRALLLAVRQNSKGKSKGQKNGEMHRLYPSYYREQIDRAAAQAGVDPHLVLSVIRQESFFRPDAVSHAGAIGLMQIMPATGSTLARRLGLRRFERRQLFDPETSIRMGSEFLGQQVRAFDADTTQELSIELGLAAYNAGPHNARKWLARFPHDDTDTFVERIPYKETRLYVKKVLKNYQIYKAL